MTEGANKDGRTRLDKWLWAARFFKTRSLATHAIELGRVRVGGERIKPAREVHVGDQLEIVVGETRLEVIVRALGTIRGSATVARLLYEEAAASVARREQRAALRRYGAEPAAELKGRPTKKEGRLLRRAQSKGP